jgi:hypothetical protein
METLLVNEDLKTLVSCVNALVNKGFSEDFKVNDKGLRSLKTDTIYQPDEVKVLSFYRFEGTSDPADESILYAIETNDGHRGTLVDAFGPYADTKVTAFMSKVEDVSKKVDRDEEL